MRWVEREVTDNDEADQCEIERSRQRTTRAIVWLGVCLLLSSFIWYWMRFWVPLILCIPLGSICLYFGWIAWWVTGAQPPGELTPQSSAETDSTVSFLAVSGSLVVLLSFLLAFVSYVFAQMAFDFSGDMPDTRARLEPLLTDAIPILIAVFGAVAAVLTITGIQVLRGKRRWLLDS